MSKKEKNIQSPAAPAERGSRRWLWIALAVVLVIVAVAVGWYLIRYQFYNEYKQYIQAPAALGEGTKFIGMIDDDPAITGWALYATDEEKDVYLEPGTGEVAMFNKEDRLTYHYASFEAAEKGELLMITDFKAGSKEKDPGTTYYYHTVEEAEANKPYQETEGELVKAGSLILVAKNDIIKLYANAATGEVAVHDTRTGKTVYSNPPAADQDPIAKSDLTKGAIKSQFSVEYFNANQVDSKYYSYNDCVAYGNLECQLIEDGVRFIYDIGQKREELYLPHLISDERFQELYEGLLDLEKGKTLQTTMTGRENSFYVKGEDGNWHIKGDGSQTTLINKTALHNAFIELGMTDEEYIEWQAKAGVTVPVMQGFDVTLDWKLVEDGVECTILPGQINERKGAKITAIHLLPFMGAAGLEETGYILVPNGSGALINFNNGKTKTDAYNQYVYDRDLVDAGYEVIQNLQSARLPLFAICREDSTMLATIEQGESFARITADVAGIVGDVSTTKKTNAYNNAYVQFNLRSFEKIPILGTAESMKVIEDEICDDPLTVRFTMLDQDHLGYSGVAKYYRERLIREGVLTMKEEGGDIPFYYDVIGAVKETAHTMGVQHLSVKPMTTFEQAGEIADELNRQGVSNQVMNFQGWMNGGYYHDVTNWVSVQRQLGGLADLDKLAQTMEKYGELYVDVAFQRVTAISKRYNSTEESSRYYGQGYSVSLGEVNPANLRQTSGLGYRENLYYLISPKFLPRYVDGFINAIREYDKSIGISLRDMGYELHSDKKRTEVISREEALMVVDGQLEKLRGTERSLMVNGGNLYALKGASHVIGAPMAATEFFIVDEAVPLYQMILHGCVDYTGKPMNTYVSDNTTADLLELIEYGASPRYIFTMEKASEMKYTGLNKFYATTFETWKTASEKESWKNSAAENYRFVNEALRDVSNAVMLRHESLSDTLKCVEYSNGVKIYINYGKEAAEADGHTIAAQYYLVVGGENK